MSIVITGITVQSPLGCSLEESLTTLQAGTPRVGLIENIETAGFFMKAAGEIRKEGHVVKTPPEVDRKVHFLNLALEDLIRESNLYRRYAPQERMMNLGSGVDYMDIDTYYHRREYLNNHHRLPDSYSQTGTQLKSLALKYGILGGCHVFASACVASAQAVGLSYRLLKHGWNGAILTGGTESMISYINYIGFYLLGAMSSETEAPVACKPFDKQRSGTVLGEGAVLMLLEDSHRAREGSVLAELAGYGCTQDAWAITDPEPSATMLAKAIKLALQDAGISSSAIDCVHLHGTGTHKNAPAEYQALLQVFGDRTNELPVYSMKGQTGHLIGACTALEMLGVIHSIRNQEVLPTVNFREQDPEAPLYVVRNRPLRLPIRYVLKLNSAFGGHNTALIIKKYE